MFSTWVLCESSAVDLLATQRTSICRLCLVLPTHLLFMLICLYQYLCDHLPDRFCKSYAFLPLMLTCVIILSISSYLIYLRLQYQKCMWRPKCQKCIRRLKCSFRSVFIQRVFLQKYPTCYLLQPLSLFLPRPGQFLPRPLFCPGHYSADPRLFRPRSLFWSNCQPSLRRAIGDLLPDNHHNSITIVSQSTIVHSDIKWYLVRVLGELVPLVAPQYDEVASER